MAKLDLAPWELRDSQRHPHAVPCERTGDWLVGVGGDWIFWVGARHIEQSADFNLVIGSSVKACQIAIWLDRRTLRPAEVWDEAWRELRVGHLFFLDEAKQFFDEPQQPTWKVFLRANGLGSWTRISSFPGYELDGHIEQNFAQNFRWHAEEAAPWLERPAYDWFAAFASLARDEASDVAFAARWAPLYPEARDRQSVCTAREDFECFERAIQLAILTDDGLWQNEVAALFFQFQLAQDEAPGERAWFRNGDHSGSIERSGRFERLWQVLLTYFEPQQGGPLARYECVQQWLSENRVRTFDSLYWRPTQHEKLEALLELDAFLKARGLNSNCL